MVRKFDSAESFESLAGMKSIQGLFGGWAWTPVLHCEIGMSEILSVAIYETLPGKEEESLATMAELGAVLRAGGYSRDMLYRDQKDAVQYVLLRYWKSEEARRSAQEDPDVQRCWARLAHEIRIVRVYETLDDVVRR